MDIIIGSVLIRYLPRRQSWPDFISGHRFYHFSSFILIARILHYQSIFMHFLFYCTMDACSEIGKHGPLRLCIE